MAPTTLVASKARLFLHAIKHELMTTYEVLLYDKLMKNRRGSHFRIFFRDTSFVLPQWFSSSENVPLRDKTELEIEM